MVGGLLDLRQCDGTELRSMLHGLHRSWIGVLFTALRGIH